MVEIAKSIFNFFVILPLKALFLFILFFVNDFGFSIILYTIILKTLMLPISYFLFLEEKKQLKVKERIEKETKEIKDILKKAEIMNKIYQEENFDPIKNILFQILILPIYLGAIIVVWDLIKKSALFYFLGIIDLTRPNIILGGISIFFNIYYIFTQPPESRKIMFFIFGVLSVIILTLPSFLLIYFLANFIYTFLERRAFSWYYINFVVKPIQKDNS